MDSHRSNIFETKCYYFHEVYVYNAGFKLNFIFVGVLNIILAVVTGTLNILTLIIIYKTRSLHTPSNVFISGLAFWDSLCGLITFPMNSVLNFMFSQAESSCGLRLALNFVGYFFGHCGILTLALIATDRYVSVFYPFNYEMFHSSRQRISIVMITAWTISLVTVVASFFTPKFMLYTIFVAITLVCLLIWTVYSQGKIAKIARQILREVHPASSCSKRERATQNRITEDVRANCSLNIPNNHDNETSQNDTDINSSIRTAKNELREEKRKAHDNLKAMKVTVMIVGAQYICYLPHAIVVILYLFVTPTTTLHMVHGWTATLSLMNSTLNPLIYCWQLKGFVKAAREFLTKQDHSTGCDF